MVGDVNQTIVYRLFQPLFSNITIQRLISEVKNYVE